MTTNYKGYSIFVLFEGKMREADWNSTKAGAKRRVDMIFERSVHNVKVVTAVNLQTGEIVAGRSNLHTYPED